MLGIFVTGTDTGVGKTVVSSLVVASLRRFRRTAYWKPVQTGIEQDDDTAEVRRLANCADDEIVDAGIRLPRPLSPHLSARLAGRSIAIEDLSCNRWPPSEGSVLGRGGSRGHIGAS